MLRRRRAPNSRFVYNDDWTPQELVMSVLETLVGLTAAEARGKILEIDSHAPLWWCCPARTRSILFLKFARLRMNRLTP